MNINYNGMELECIESGYWPDGIDMLCTDNKVFESDVQGVVCLRSGIAFLKDGGTTSRWEYWAILPPKPAPRRLTNRELSRMLKTGYEAIGYADDIISIIGYKFCEQDSPITSNIKKLRAPNSDEWLEPTSDLLEAK